MNVYTRILTKKEISRILNVKDVISVVEDAFGQYARKNAHMPPKTYLDFKKYNGDLRVMPAYLDYADAAGVKVVNVHPDNKGKGLPTVMATIVLNDPKTGFPLAIMDGTFITAMRTGAAAAVATKHLAKENSGTLGLVGAGAQARTQLLAISQVLDLKKAFVSDVSRDYAEKFAREMGEQFDFDIEAASVQKAAGADVVSTVTPAHSPVVQDPWVREGTHINAIGADAPGKEELDPQILRRAKIFIDDWEQCSHSGEINVPLSKGIISTKDIYASLGEVVAGMKSGRENGKDITLFDSTGLAIQDIATAHFVFEKAQKEKAGLNVELF